MPWVASGLAFCNTSFCRLMIVAGNALILIMLRLAFNVNNPLMTVIPWVVFIGFCVWFRAQSHADLKLGLQPLLGVISQIFRSVFSAIMGRQAWEAVWHRCNADDVGIK